MKTTLILALATLLPAAAQVEADFEFNQQDGFAEAEANTRVEVHGDQTHVERKSVTITSENGRTVRKTTTFKNGRETTTTEILDDQGNVIEVEGGPDDAPREEQDPAHEGREPGPWLGLRVEEASAALRDQLALGEGQGVVINATAPDGPAARSGLRENDILLKLDETALGTPRDLRDALEGRQPGEKVSLTYLRRGKEERAEVILEEDPDQADRGEAREHGDEADPRPGAKKIEIGGNGAGNLDELLNDPNIPDDFKKSIRDMLERVGNIDANADAGGGNGGMKIEIRGNGIDGLDAVLDNPQLPEDFKKTARDMLDRVLGDDPANEEGEDL